MPPAAVILVCEVLGVVLSTEAGLDPIAWKVVSGTDLVELVQCLSSLFLRNLSCRVMHRPVILVPWNEPEAGEFQLQRQIAILVRPRLKLNNKESGIVSM